MKVSLRWIFDHIDADYRSIHVPDLVARFNTTVAEIESYHQVQGCSQGLQLAQVQVINGSEVVVRCPETGKEYVLPERGDTEGIWYLIVVFGKQARWAQLIDLGSSKSGLCGSLHPSEQLKSGSFRAEAESTDWILDVDNKSINHRPDLWGHRGIAREVAAIFGFGLKSLNQLATRQETIGVDEPYPIRLNVLDDVVCDRFALQFFPTVDNCASFFSIASRLARVGIRPHSSLVDLTNYVMMDLGQPMHVFDADTFDSESLLVRKGIGGETLKLLDGSSITVTTNDTVVATEHRPLALAGVMGGADSAVSKETTSILLESAHFKPSEIRASSQRHKIRTDSSARFEKNLDPNQNISAIGRFNQLLFQLGINHVAEPLTVSFGSRITPKTVIVQHEQIETSLGISLEPKFVIQTLEQLGFLVDRLDTLYTIEVPCFRATRDFDGPEDIVEEIGRYYGYDKIEPRYAQRLTQAFSQETVMQRGRIKRFFAYGAGFQEIATYALYDESFLSSIGYEVSSELVVKDPVSTNYRRPVQSLLPGIAKVVHERSKAAQQKARFFECARVWYIQKDQIIEQDQCAGMIMDQQAGIDFYAGKRLLDGLFSMLRLTVRWKQLQSSESPWYQPHISAQIMYGEEPIGRAGMVNRELYQRIAPGSAFIFELNATVLCEYKPLIQQYVPVSKYPVVLRDISLFIPRSVIVEQVERLLRDTNDTIISVQLVDRFEKPEWHDKRAVTFRLLLQDQQRTLTTQDADEIVQYAIEQLHKIGAEIR